MVSPRFNTNWFRELTTVLVAGWYLLATTGLAFLIVPAHTKTVVTPNFRCAIHSCDCRTAEQCAESCCCFPLEVAMGPGCPMHAGRVADSKPITVAVTAFAIATCAGRAGDEAAFSVSRVGPHEASVITERSRARASAHWRCDEPRLPAFPDIDGPDKVPISLS